MPAANDNTDLPEREQLAVYWAPGRPDDFGGIVYDPPEQLDCRWSEESVEFSDMQGNRQVSKAVVYPDRDLETGGFLMPGGLSSVANFTDPQANLHVNIVRAWKKIPTSDATEFLRKAML